MSHYRLKLPLSLLVIIFATQLGGSAAYSEMRSGGIELGHDLIVNTGGASHPIEAKPFEPKIETGHTDLLKSWNSQTDQPNGSRFMQSPLPKEGRGLDILTDTEIMRGGGGPTKPDCQGKYSTLLAGCSDQ